MARIENRPEASVQMRCPFTGAESTGSDVNADLDRGVGDFDLRGVRRSEGDRRPVVDDAGRLLPYAAAGREGRLLENPVDGRRVEPAAGSELRTELSIPDGADLVAGTREGLAVPIRDGRPWDMGFTLLE